MQPIPASAVFIIYVNNIRSGDTTLQRGSTEGQGGGDGTGGWENSNTEAGKRLFAAYYIIKIGFYRDRVYVQGKKYILARI